jgi:hypothetical protein
MEGRNECVGGHWTRASDGLNDADYGDDSVMDTNLCVCYGLEAPEMSMMHSRLWMR